jgi:glucosylceramidase
MYNCKYLLIGLLIALGLRSFDVNGQQIEKEGAKPQLWLTDPDHAVLFKLQNQGLKYIPTLKNIPEITVDKSKSYQQMDGFGFALTGGSAVLISQMSPTKQADLLQELFGTNKSSLGVSYLRISVGASDLDACIKKNFGHKSTC